MTKLTAKELGSINEQLTQEQVVEAKYRAAAETIGDTELKNRFNQAADMHKKHFSDLSAFLK